LNESDVFCLDITTEDGDEQGVDGGVAEQNTGDGNEEDTDQQQADVALETADDDVAQGLALYLRSNDRGM